MKLILESHHERYTVEFLSDDVAIEKMARAFTSLLLSSGFSEDSIKRVFADNTLPTEWDNAWRSE